MKVLINSLIIFILGCTSTPQVTSIEDNKLRAVRNLVANFEIDKAILKAKSIPANESGNIEYLYQSNADVGQEVEDSKINTLKYLYFLKKKMEDINKVCSPHSENLKVDDAEKGCSIFTSEYYPPKEFKVNQDEVVKKYGRTEDCKGVYERCLPLGLGYRYGDNFRVQETEYNSIHGPNHFIAMYGIRQKKLVQEKTNALKAQEQKKIELAKTKEIDGEKVRDALLASYVALLEKEWEDNKCLRFVEFLPDSPVEQEVFDARKSIYQTGITKGVFRVVSSGVLKIIDKSLVTGNLRRSDIAATEKGTMTVELVSHSKQRVPMYVQSLKCEKIKKNIFNRIDDFEKKNPKSEN